MRPIAIIFIGPPGRGSSFLVLRGSARRRNFLSRFSKKHTAAGLFLFFILQLGRRFPFSEIHAAGFAKTAVQWSYGQKIRRMMHFALRVGVSLCEDRSILLRRLNADFVNMNIKRKPSSHFLLRLGYLFFR